MRRAEPNPFRGARFLVPLAILLAVAAAAGSAQEKTHEHQGGNVPNTTAQAGIGIPDAMRVEHEELHQKLEAATRERGPVGEAAREVARVLDPHFQREEQIALPPLGLLPALAGGRFTAEMSAVLPLTDSLAAEMPEMLREHAAIGAALETLATAAHLAGRLDYLRLVDEIKLHARMEEQVNYPAAIVVGELVRMKLHDTSDAFTAR
jgi:hypothetical protein